MSKTFWLGLVLVSNVACSKLAWSKLLHGPLIDDGRLLIPALADILLGDEAPETKIGAFGQVVLADPQRLFEHNERPTDAEVTEAVLAYFGRHAEGFRLQFVEDYKKQANDTLSICFSQAVNGTRIYGTGACAEVRGNELLYAWHLFVVPPSVCTEPDVSQQRAEEVVLEHLGAEPLSAPPAAELNVAFLHGAPTLVWRVPVKRQQNTQTFFVHAKTGRIAAITTAFYRSTRGFGDGSGVADGAGAAEGVVGRKG